MSGSIIKLKNGTKAIRLLCTILFIAFVFIYLLYYQADVLAVTQYILSDGHTQYNRKIGATLITVILYLLHLGVTSLFKDKQIGYPLTFFPSLLILAFITDVEITSDNHICFGVSGWLFGVLITIYGVLLWLFSQQKGLSESEGSKKNFFVRFAWLDFLMMFLMFFMVGTISSHNDIFHYRVHMEQRLLNNDFKNALSIGKDALQTDSSLTMLRIYALSKENHLGETLFELPLTGGSDAMLPHNNVRTYILPETLIYHNLGVVLKQTMCPLKYMMYIEKHHLAKKIAGDYLLCGYLLDKDLDAFVDNISKYYNIKDSLPKHYREALILYTHLHSTPKIVYHSNVMDIDFQDFQNLNRIYPERTVRINAVRDTYGKTYWYYYQYVTF